MPHNNANTGTLWKNKKKVTERHPDYTGNAELSREVLNAALQNGGKLRMSAWIKEVKTKFGPQKVMSISFEIKQEEGSAKASTRNASGSKLKIDDDVPF